MAQLLLPSFKAQAAPPAPRSTALPPSQALGELDQLVLGVRLLGGDRPVFDKPVRCTLNKVAPRKLNKGKKQHQSSRNTSSRSYG